MLPSFRSAPLGPIKQKLLSRVAPTGVERRFPERDIIVSKTDLKGTITYANRVFLDVAGLTEREVIGAPHSFLRHPDMPRAVFALLWERLAAGKEIFAYVVNLAANGDHYWVHAHVTPTFGASGEIVGFHSNRRVPHPAAVEKIKPIYRKLREIEDNNANRANGLAQSRAHLNAILAQAGVTYDQFVFSLAS
ncbi:PAS domain S-box-containing protein [Rhodoblastus acidophilus]|nr:PAS domain S-box-containing protein [Rhodoblastus acidophilus]MCW2334392.1 PAS domain S-box-containing protein [Rhodoblastus acidophilus]